MDMFSFAQVDMTMMLSICRMLALWSGRVPLYC